MPHTDINLFPLHLPLIIRAIVAKRDALLHCWVDPLSTRSALDIPEGSGGLLYFIIGDYTLQAVTLKLICAVSYRLLSRDEVAFRSTVT